MGALVGLNCYPSNDLAVDAVLTGKEPALTSGSISYLSWFEKESGVWQLKRQSIDTGGQVVNLPSVAVTLPTFPTCDESQALNDGLQVGWALTAVILAAWGLLQIKRLIR